MFREGGEASTSYAPFTSAWLGISITLQGPTTVQRVFSFLAFKQLRSVGGTIRVAPIPDHAPTLWCKT